MAPGQRASGRPSLGRILTFAFPASLPLIFGKKNCENKPPPPRVAATQLRKGGLSWAANKWIKETWEEMNDVTKSEGSRGSNSLLPRSLAQNRSDYFGHDATMTTKPNSCLQYISTALSTCIGGRMKSESLIKAFLLKCSICFPSARTSIPS